MSPETLAPPKSAPGSMLPVVLLTQVAKRLGLAKPMVRLALEVMLSPKKKAKAFEGYDPTRHDVLVATFGKSGTNWMMQIAQQIAHRGEAEFDHIHDVVAWPDTPVPGTVGLVDPGPQAQSPTGLRVIKTHLETAYVPYSADAKYLTVLRDPKEVLVSSYYFLGGLFAVLNHLSIDDWFGLFTRSGAMAASWAEHTASFWAWRDRPNVLVLNYRDVKKEPRRCLERVADVMGVPLTEAQLEKVLERSSFAYMKARESQFAPPLLPLMKLADRPLMVRRGQTGESEELLSVAQQAAIDRISQEELRRLGSDFPYASFFDVAIDPDA